MSTEGFNKIMSLDDMCTVWLVMQQNDTITKQVSFLVLKGMLLLFQCCTISCSIDGFVSRCEIHQYDNFSDRENGQAVCLPYIQKQNFRLNFTVCKTFYSRKHLFHKIYTCQHFIISTFSYDAFLCY